MSSLHPRNLRLNLVVARVPRNYDPGYPSRLSRADYHELVAIRMPLRLLRAAATASVAFSLAACDPKPTPTLGETPPGPKDPIRPRAPDDLERRIVALIDEMKRDATRSSWFSLSRFVRNTADEKRLGAPQWEARVPISYGNSYSGIFDVSLARKRAVQAFAAYGIEIERNVAIQGDGISATVDGLHRDSGLGFELRDPTEPVLDFSGGPTVDYAKQYDASIFLDDAEITELRAAGWRIHVADPKPRFDGDEFTPGMAYLASIIEYLDRETDGPDFDIETVLFPSRQIVTVKARFEPPLPAELVASEGIRFKASASTRVVLEVTPGVIEKIEIEQIDPSVSIPRAVVRTATESIASTLGRPTIVYVGLYAGDVTKRRLTQDRGELESPIVLESMEPWFLLPSTFDAAKPFRIEMQIKAGDDVSVSREVKIGSRRSK